MNILLLKNWREIQNTQYCTCSQNDSYCVGAADARAGEEPVLGAPEVVEVGPEVVKVGPEVVEDASGGRRALDARRGGSLMKT